MLLCAALVALPFVLAPLAAFLSAFLPVAVAPVAVAPVAVAPADTAPTGPAPVLRVAVARVARPVAEREPVVRARRGAGGRYAAAVRSYAPAPALETVTVY